MINDRRTIYHCVKVTLYLKCAILNPILFPLKKSSVTSQHYELGNLSVFW